jgi:polysaccharide biosynthesis transport protein
LRSQRRELPLLQVSARLSVLAAGRPDSNPIAGLTSDRMQLVLEQSAAEFEWVLLDAPPVGLMPDARLLANATGAVLLVIGAGATPYTLVQRAVAELGSDCIVGTVLNRVERASVPATSYYHHYYSDAFQGADAGSASVPHPDMSVTQSSDPKVRA